MRRCIIRGATVLLAACLCGETVASQAASSENTVLTIDNLLGNWGSSFVRDRLPFDISGSKIRFNLSSCRWLPFTVIEEREDKGVPEKHQRRITIRVHGIKQRHACTEDEVMAFIIENGTCLAVRDSEVRPMQPCEAAIWVFRSFDEWKDGLQGELLIYERSPNVFTTP